MADLNTRVGFTTSKDKTYGLVFNFQADSEQKKCSSTITIPVFYDGWKNVAHGGITATLLDEAMANACGAAGYPNVATVELNVKYIRPVPTEKELLVIAEISEVKGKLLKTKAKLYLDKKLLATSSGKMYIIPEDWNT